MSENASAAGSTAGPAAAESHAVASAAHQAGAATGGGGGGGVAGATQKRKNLTEDERKVAIFDLLERSKDGKVPRGPYAKVGAKFGATHHTMTR